MATLPSVLPVALKIEGRPCLVVGAGNVGARKSRDLLAAGGVVTIVSPNVSQLVRQVLRDEPRVTLIERCFQPSDLDGVFLVITTTGDIAVDELVAKESEQRNILYNSADDPERCNFYLTALVRRDPVVVSISTAGASPAMASYLRRRLDAALEPALAETALILHSVRAQLHNEGVQTEFLPWANVVNDDLVALVASGDHAGARDLVLRTVRPA